MREFNFPPIVLIGVCTMQSLAKLLTIKNHFIRKQTEKYF